MHPYVLIFVVLFAIACAGPGPTATPAAVCQPTQPNGDTPPGKDPNPSSYGNGRLYTTGLWDSGEIRADPRFVEADGSIGMKFAWWRAPGVGAAGDLQITGHELRTGAAFVPSIPDGYGQDFQATGSPFRPRDALRSRPDPATRS
jgi:hypothetical protein